MTVGLLSIGRAPSYAGPGDIMPSWVIWAGLRAYNLAMRGTACVDIYNTVTTAIQTFNTLANGDLDAASIATFLGGNPGLVSKLWDQSGNGFHLTQATVANMPQYVASVPSLGGRPGMFFKKANSTLLASSSNSLATAVGTMTAVGGRMTDDGANFSYIFTSGSAPSGIAFSDRDGVQGFAGTFSPSPCLDLSSHAIDCVFNGTSSLTCIDGSVRSYDCGGATFNGGSFKVGLNMTGVVGEVGFHPSLFSQAGCAAQNANKNSYWFSATAYEGLVASRARRLETADGTNQYVQCRSGHVAAENLTSIAIAFESQSGAASTLTQAIEYPAGTFTQVKWLGAASYTFSSVYVMISDYIPVSIPAGATFWIRSYWADSIAGSFYNPWQNSFYGEATTLSTTPLTDLTMGGTIANSGAFSMPPCGIIGMTSNPSVFVGGDSIVQGLGAVMEDQSNTATGHNGKVGIIANSIGGQPFLNCGVSGSSVMPPGCGRMIPKVTHVINQIGINKLRGGASAATYIAAIASFLALTKPKQRRYQTTMTPDSTDPATPSAAFTTLGQQTGHSSNPQRVIFNDALRGGTTGLNLTGVIDVNNPLESSVDSGFWKVTPSPPYTSDGLHPNAAGYTAVINSNPLPAFV